LSKLFEKNTLNGMQLSNRFVRSATREGMAADNGAVTPRLMETFNALAEGGVGLIISGSSYVHPYGQGGPGQLGVYKDELIPGLREMTASVHERGGRIVMQLTHAGYYAAENLTGHPPLVVSDFESLAKSPRREATIQDIQEVVSAFGDAAGRAKSAGFDGVQIHSAHGYFLSEFLSPKFNKRTDEYGGSISNRARIHLEIYRAIRRVVGSDYPILMKMNCRDFDENGLTLDDSVQAASLLADAGLDAIEVSGGLPTSGALAPIRTGINSVEREAYFKEEIRAFRKAVSIPLILVGGIRSFEVAEKIIDDELADYVSLCRPLIREPDLINRWKAGDHRKAECISDNLCLKPALEGMGVYCVSREREKEK